MVAATGLVEDERDDIDVESGLLSEGGEQGEAGNEHDVAEIELTNLVDNNGHPSQPGERIGPNGTHIGSSGSNKSNTVRTKVVKKRTYHYVEN